jgi:hypothetical protein
MSTNVERVLNEIKALSPAELEEIRQIVDELLTKQARVTDRSLQQMLHDAGLLSEVKMPRRDEESFHSYQPITVKGKPVSETIIEERR